MLFAQVGQHTLYTGCAKVDENLYGPSMRYFEIMQFFKYEVDLQNARYVNLHQESTSS